MNAAHHLRFPPIRSLSLSAVLLMAMNAAGQSPTMLAVLPRPKLVVAGPTARIGADLAPTTDWKAFKPVIDALAEDFETGAAGPKQAVKVVHDSAVGDEAYRIDIGRRITLRAATPVGVAHGLQTLFQLRGTEVSAREIQDSPEARFRCVMVDVARRYHSLSTLRTLVRWCSASKVNLLQLHLTDDQNWMFPTDVLPGVDARNSSGHPAYTRAELTQLQEFAYVRGVTIVPEIEMPGHCALAAAWDPKVMRIEGSASTNCLNFASPAVRSICKRLLAEVARLFPRSPYIHLGGDEAWYPGAENNPAFQSAASAIGPKATPEDVFVDFLGDMAGQVLSDGKTPIIWEGFHAGSYAKRRIPNHTIVVAWEGTYYPAEQLGPDGWRVINAGWDPFYVVNHYPYDVDTLVPLAKLYNVSYHDFRIVDTQDTSFKGFRFGDKADLEGAMLCWWEGREWNAVSTLPMRIAAFGARLWNPPGEHDYLSFLRRLAAIDIGIARASYPFTVRVEGTLPADPAVFTDQARVHIASEKKDIQFAVRSDGGIPSLSDLHSGSIVAISHSSVVSIQAFRGGKPVGETKFVKLTKAKLVPNLAMGRLVSTDAPSDPEFPAGRVTSGAYGVLDSYWLAYPNPRTLTIDLGSVQTFNRIDVVVCWASTEPSHYRLSVSDDGTSFRPVVDASNQSFPTTEQGFIHRFPAVTAHYVRLETLKGNLYPSSMMRVNQVRVFDERIPVNIEAESR